MSVAVPSYMNGDFLNLDLDMYAGECSDFVNY